MSTDNTDCEIWFSVHLLSLESGYPDSVSSWFSQSLQANTVTLSYIRPRPLPSTLFPIRHSPILSFDAVYSELMRKRHNINYKKINAAHRWLRFP
jgi:hypothetical protein